MKSHKVPHFFLFIAGFVSPMGNRPRTDFTTLSYNISTEKRHKLNTKLASACFSAASKFPAVHRTKVNVSGWSTISIIIHEPAVIRSTQAPHFIRMWTYTFFLVFVDVTSFKSFLVATVATFHPAVDVFNFHRWTISTATGAFNWEENMWWKSNVAFPLSLARND